MKRRFKVIFSLFAILAVCMAGCGGQRSGPVHSDTCFIYTDGLLDDLCAMEYLAERYDHAVIMLHNPNELADSQYASHKVKDERALLNTVSQWIVSAAVYSDSADISEADLHLLARLTEFADMLKEDPSLCSKLALLMAGDSDGPDGAGEEWNAAADTDAYRYVTENMTDLLQATRPECEAEYEKNGYPFQAQFLDEYVEKMSSIGENLCCYDLQAAAIR